MSDKTDEVLGVVVQILGETTEAVGKIEQALEAQTQAIQVQTEHTPSKRFFVNTNVVALFVLSCVIAFGSYQNQQAYNADAERRTQTRAIIEQIESCTTPEGECSKRGQASQANAVLALNCATEANLRKVVPQNANSIPAREECKALGIV